jgi:hypothetical protein
VIDASMLMLRSHSGISTKSHGDEDHQSVIRFSNSATTAGRTWFAFTGSFLPTEPESKLDLIKRDMLGM